MAACLEFIMKYHGAEIKQKEIIKRVWGDKRNEPITSKQMIDSLETWEIDLNNFKKVFLEFEFGVFNSDYLINELRNNWLVILSFGNEDYRHANVVVSATYKRANKLKTIENLKLYDPLFNKGFIYKSWSEIINNPPLLIKVRYIYSE